MDDRELLELAAKAARISHDGAGYVSEKYLPMNWDPFADDGDAFRLAAGLGMVVDMRYKNGGMRAFNEITYWIGEDGSGKSIAFGEHAQDETRIVCRRAIVCAAAEIGKVMP